jgi:cell division protein FtsX
MKRVISITAAAGGILLSLLGAILVLMYVIEALLKRLGDADQSLLFWYLPILFIGAGVLAIGVLLSIWGVRRLRPLKD